MEEEEREVPEGCECGEAVVRDARNWFWKGNVVEDGEDHEECQSGRGGNQESG